MTESELCFLSATALAGKLRTREVSAREVMEAHLARVALINPRVNAIVTLVAERAMEAAATADEVIARGGEAGPLHGLPIAHKDLFATKGIRTTQGSKIMADFVPDEDSPVVARVKAAGAITIGKTNTPEFGAGSQTYNDVFGETRNPYDLSRTCGGSSGGAAVALATGMIPIADGTDTGGSLRNPASFCNVVGFRTSPGLIGHGRWSTLDVAGPMGRTVADVALLLSVQAGFDPRSPLTQQIEPGIFRQPLDSDVRGLRVAWSRDLGGLPVDPRVTAVLEAQRQTLVELGCEVIDIDPPLDGADEIFETFRAHNMALTLEPLYEEHRGEMKPTLIWNIEQGIKLTGAELRRAERGRAILSTRMRRFMERYDVVACPVSQVPPFPIEQRYVTEICGQPMATYIEWMRSCSRISATAHPSISVPAGFTPDGLPVGIQFVGRYRGELGLLKFAHVFEQATRFGERRPEV